ncbi:NXPE family member 3-like isoform X2 [Lytechinus variegatus]|uniref:NXPE family member 3-like isoform X2 n=1 Tax=Lytechinus variegatus TaxID=7654 RepID=UPI001BB0E80F|nr:NXPE family member 3-like isoform X2 [Lytechinus variegatus]
MVREICANFRLAFYVSLCISIFLVMMYGMISEQSQERPSRIPFFDVMVHSSNGTRYYTFHTTIQTPTQEINNSRPETAGVTSDQFSTFQIKDAETEYHICDRLDVIIQAKDAQHVSKVNGGDYFRVRIFNNDLKAGASPDGEIVYLGDGKYKASFTLRWVGKTFVRAILVHPAEAVKVLRRVRDTYPTRCGYSGRFTKTVANQTFAEDTLCNVVPPKENVSICDLTRSGIDAPWFCTAPKKANLSCSDFSWTSGNSVYSKSLLEHTMTTEEQKLFTRQKKEIRAQGANFVTVTDQDKNTSSLPPHCHNERLPPCYLGSYNLSSSVSAGYLLKGQWYSNFCRLRAFAIPETLKCLTNKTLYFHGDSTTRQYFEYLVETLKGTLKPNPPTKQSNWKVGPSLAEDRVHNFTVHYRHHGYPIRNNWTDASEVQYIEEALDELAATPDTVFMFTIWAHLTTVNMSFYEHRVRRIKAAVERLHRRSPETLVVIKSANTRSHPSWGSSATYSDWYAKELDLKLRDVFKSYDNKIGFIDQWSMVVGFSNRDAIHPDKAIVSSGVRTLLSYICPK